MFDHILVPLDGSTLAECVLPHLVGLAKAFDAQATVLCVLEPKIKGEMNHPIDPVAWEMKKTEREAYLQDVARRLAEIDMPVEQVLLEGEPASCIKEFIDKNAVDLIVLSSHGRSGLSRWNVSSVVRKVIQRAHRSIMLIRAYEPKQSDLKEFRYHHLLLPLDGSQRAECLLAPTEILAQYHESQLLVAHVVVKPEMMKQMPLTAEDEKLLNNFIERNKQAAATYLERLSGRLSYKFEPHLQISSNVALSLHELVDAAGVDLLIMSAHGFSGQTKWPYGSIATSFIEYGSTPLLIVQDLEPEEVGPTKAEEAVAESKGH